MTTPTLLLQIDENQAKRKKLATLVNATEKQLQADRAEQDRLRREYRALTKQYQDSLQPPAGGVPARPPVSS